MPKVIHVNLIILEKQISQTLIGHNRPKIHKLKQKTNERAITENLDQTAKSWNQIEY